MSDLKDIWLTDPAPDDKGLSDERLMAYLEGKLSPEEAHEVERWLGSEGMESDALEGLQSLTPEETRQIAGRLQMKLRQAIKKKHPRRGIMDQQWSLIAVIVVLLLLAVSFAVFYYIRKGQ